MGNQEEEKKLFYLFQFLSFVKSLKINPFEERRLKMEQITAPEELKIKKSISL